MGSELKELIVVDGLKTYRLVGSKNQLLQVQKQIDKDRSKIPELMDYVRRSSPCFCGSKKKYKHCCASKFGVLEPPNVKQKLTRGQKQKRDKAIKAAIKRSGKIH